MTDSKVPFIEPVPVSADQPPENGIGKTSNEQFERNVATYTKFPFTEPVPVPATEKQLQHHINDNVEEQPVAMISADQPPENGIGKTSNKQCKLPPNTSDNVEEQPCAMISADQPPDKWYWKNVK